MKKIIPTKIDLNTWGNRATTSLVETECSKVCVRLQYLLS